MQKGRWYFVDDRPVEDVVELVNRLKGLLEENPGREVVIDSTEEYGIEFVKQLAALVHQLGAKRVRWPDWVNPNEIAPQAEQRANVGPAPDVKE